MGVGFVVGDTAREVGSADFLKAFFSTISYYLEPEGWGTKYPELMLQLYHGRLDARDATRVLEQVPEIKDRLRTIRPVRIIWDIDNPDAKPPWKDIGVPVDMNLSNCFITSNGKDLFDVLVECLRLQVERCDSLTIEPY